MFVANLYFGSLPHHSEVPKEGLSYDCHSTDGAAKLAHEFMHRDSKMRLFLSCGTVIPIDESA